MYGPFVINQNKKKLSSFAKTILLIYSVLLITKSCIITPTGTERENDSKKSVRDYFDFLITNMIFS